WSDRTPGSRDCQNEGSPYKFRYLKLYEGIRGTVPQAYSAIIPDSFWLLLQHPPIVVYTSNHLISCIYFTADKQYMKCVILRVDRRYNAYKEGESKEDKV